MPRTEQLVRRWILTIASLVVIALWLLMAYVPGLPRPALNYPAWSATALVLVAAAGLVVFLLIQGWLVRATARFLGADVPPAQAVILAEFKLSRGREVFLTALPILMTLGLAALAYGLWASLLA